MTGEVKAIGAFTREAVGQTQSWILQLALFRAEGRNRSIGRPLNDVSHPVRSVGCSTATQLARPEQLWEWPGGQVAWEWQVKETGCQGRGRDEVQPWRANLSPSRTAILSTSLTWPAGKGRPQLDFNEEKGKGVSQLLGQTPGWHEWERAGTGQLCLNQCFPSALPVAHLSSCTQPSS